MASYVSQRSYDSLPARDRVFLARQIRRAVLDDALRSNDPAPADACERVRAKTKSGFAPTWPELLSLIEYAAALSKTAEVESVFRQYVDYDTDDGDFDSDATDDERTSVRWFT